MAIAAHDKFRVTHHGIEYEFEVAEEGGYIARVPAYPSCITEGDSFEEALENVQDGLVEILTTARKLGLEIPDELVSVA
ncbi:MAG: type II toxin-antitoxin system HicB family antitoxin [Chloroflexota bacterium]|jgi:predicted RNase H-like HicB family nuclease